MKNITTNIERFGTKSDGKSQLIADFTPPSIGMTSLCTKNYTQFNLLDWNRKISRNKVAKLVTAIKSANLTRYYPILVTRKFEILDGQHRYVACTELNMPIHYIMVDDCDIATVASINNNQDKWTAYDFLDAYCHAGYHEYKVIKAFMKKYDFRFSSAFVLLFGKWGGSGYEEFRKGTIKVTNLKEATARANWLQTLKKLCEHCGDRYFILAMVQCFKHPDYDHKRMVKKMKYRGSGIKKAMNKSEYLRQLETIYNTQTSDKVRFW